MGSGPSQEIGGVRVFKVCQGSPAAEAGLEVFFDFILEVNGGKMDQGHNEDFAKKIKESENGTAKLAVFNTRSHTIREVLVKPRQWGGHGLLGATVRFDSVDPAENQGIRVLEVFPNSPAAHAGFVPQQDFLLGTPNLVFRDIDDLVEAVSMSINKELQVYVYNVDSETVREVPLVPNHDWGGEGCIGCDIGTGLLHRIPAPRRPPGSMPEGFAGVPAAAWAPGASLPPPVYPPNHAGAGLPPQVGFPAGAPAPINPQHGVPTGAVPVPGVTSATSITGVTGVPPVPTAPPGATPAIRPTGSWAPPSAPAAPQTATQPPAAGLAYQTPGPGQVAAPVPAPQTREVAGVTWPPAPKQEVTLPAEVAMGGAVSADFSSPGPARSAADTPQAPPSTPMNESDLPPQADLSGLDSKFGSPAGMVPPAAPAAAVL